MWVPEKCVGIIRLAAKFFSRLGHVYEVEYGCSVLRRYGFRRDQYNRYVHHPLKEGSIVEYLSVSC